MKYSLTYHQNNNCITINVDIKLADDTIEMLEPPEGPSNKYKKFARELFDIGGVSGIAFSQYKLGITKGSTFEWETIVKEAIMLMLMHYCSNQKAVEISQPLRGEISTRPLSRKRPLHVYSLPDISDILA